MNSLKKLLTFALVLLASNQIYTKDIITITEQELQSGGQNLEIKLRQAARDGFFYVQIPTKAQDLIAHGLDFANNFYKDTHFTSLVDLPKFTGYRKHEHSQVEGFYCEREFWHELYPAEVAQLADCFNNLSLDLFRKIVPLVLDQLPVEKYNQATGGLYNDRGMYHFEFKHYRTEQAEIGINPHQDTGYITLLFIDKKGLYVKINDIWQPVPPKPGYLIVNFGGTFEILVNDKNKLQASWHFVERITPEKHGGDRINFALFSNNSLDVPAQRALVTGELEVVCASYQEFLEKTFLTVYQQMDIPEIRE